MRTAAARTPQHDAEPKTHDLRDDVVRGLAAAERRLPSKYFYDDEGAVLFDRICELDEYYPTRTEIGILRRSLPDIAHAIGPAARVLEFGSGSGIKTRLLLEHLETPREYVAVDISRAQLIGFTEALAADFTQLRITPVCADYTQDFTLAAAPPDVARTVAFFPGSTIGNFEPLEAAAFLRRLSRLCGRDGALLLGTDLQKDTAIIDLAYNDARGVTAAFNRNLLARINRECGADFDLGAFRHRAWYDVAHHRIEMQLVCTHDCTVTLPAFAGAPAVRFDFRAGEPITTEYSYKYTFENVHELATQSGWRIERCWMDDRCWFGVWLLTRSEP